MLPREMSLLLIEMVCVEEDFCVWVLLIPLAVVAAVGMSISCGDFRSPLGWTLVVELCVRDKEIKYGRGMLIYSSCDLLESIYATELCYLHLLF